MCLFVGKKFVERLVIAVSRLKKVKSNMKRSKQVAIKARANVSIDWVEIPGGKFILGLTEAQAELLLYRLAVSLKESGDEVRPYLKEVLSQEVPAQVVTLKPFYIS